ncbi:hypothetical protein ALC53_08888 [Atta colombica]|uniref:Uncharacterized protein n=1 Tax=Atta colombica TaxID=520822 RepID=A0A195B952_9HYME|nr:hypothetical protein ALC53_08888 [Atta colombica]
MFTRRIVRFLYGSQKRIMGWHSVRKWKRPIPSILRARPRANDEEYGAHDAPKRKTGDMDQVGFRAADFSQKTAKRTSRPLHSASHMPLFPRGRPTKHFHVQWICARLILFPSGPVNIGYSSRKIERERPGKRREGTFFLVAATKEESEGPPCTQGREGSEENVVLCSSRCRSSSPGSFLRRGQRPTKPRSRLRCRFNRV